MTRVLDEPGQLIEALSEAKNSIRDGTMSGSMILKVETCIAAIERGVEGIVILNGKKRQAVLLELLTEHGAGTLIVRWGGFNAESLAMGAYSHYGTPCH